MKDLGVFYNRTKKSKKKSLQVLENIPKCIICATTGICY